MLGPSSVRRHGKRELLGRDSTACEVEVLGRRTATFAVEGHHFALLLSIGWSRPLTEYNVRLDGRRSGRRTTVRPRQYTPATTSAGQLRSIVQDRAPQPTSTEPLARALARTGIDGSGYTRGGCSGDVDWPDALVLLGDRTPTRSHGYCGYSHGATFRAPCEGR